MVYVHLAKQIRMKLWKPCNGDYKENFNNNNNNDNNNNNCFSDDKWVPDGNDRVIRT